MGLSQEELTAIDWVVARVIDPEAELSMDEMIALITEHTEVSCGEAENLLTPR